MSLQQKNYKRHSMLTKADKKHYQDVIEDCASILGLHDTVEALLRVYRYTDLAQMVDDLGDEVAYPLS